MTDSYRIGLSPVKPEAAPEQARPLLDKAKQKLGMVPNMYAAMANAPGVLDTYLHGYALFREDSGFTPAEQEVVFLTISYENDCHYCMAAHSTLADKASRVPAEVTDAIRGGERIPDARLQALREFTRIMVRTGGRPGADDARRFLDADFEDRHILEIVLAIAVKTLSNYTNHLFETEVDAPFRGREWKAPRTQG